MSSLKVKNIKITKHNFLEEAKDKTSLLAKHIAEAASLGIDAIALLPKTTTYKLSFVLENTDVAIASAIRRGYVTDCPCYGLICDLPGAQTTDVEALVEEIQQSVEGLRLAQDVLDKNKGAEWKAELKYFNDHEYPVQLDSYMMRMYDAAGKEVDITTMCDSIPLNVKLAPGKQVSVSCTMGYGRGSENGNRYKMCGEWMFEDTSDKKKSTLEHVPTSFALGYTTYGNVSDPCYFIRKICDDIVERTERILSAVSELKGIETQQTEFLSFTNEGLYYQYMIQGETATVIAPIEYYMRVLCPEIFIVAGKEHDQDTGIFIKITHTSPHKIVIDACKKAITDMRTIRSAFD